MNKLPAWLMAFVLGVTIGVTQVSFAEHGIVVTKNGLKYKDLEIGTGAEATVGNIAVIHITGWLDDKGKNGEEFICSRDYGKPVSFKLGTKKVMPGWNLGVTGMKVGGKRRLMVPSELGYGNKGVSNIVPPNTDLIFDVELLKIK